MTGYSSTTNIDYVCSVIAQHTALFNTHINVYFKSVYICVYKIDMNMYNTQPNLKTCNRLYVDSDTMVKLTAKSVLKYVKTVNKRVEESLEIVDNPLNHPSATKRYVSMLSNMAEYRRRIGLSAVCVEMLVYMYNLYVSNGSGGTVYGVAKVFTKSAKVGSEIDNVRNKLKLLERKGLLVNVGNTSNGSALFIPSVKAVEDIENIFK